MYNDFGFEDSLANVAMRRERTSKIDYKDDMKWTLKVRKKNRVRTKC